MAIPSFKLANNLCGGHSEYTCAFSFCCMTHSHARFLKRRPCQGGIEKFNSGLAGEKNELFDQLIGKLGGKGWLFLVFFIILNEKYAEM